MPYNKFAREIGSIVVLDLEKGDIGGFVPGTRESFSFDISVNMILTFSEVESEEMHRKCL